MNRSPEEVYQAAIALEPVARKRFLDENCADPAVRAEVERLFAGQSTKTIAISTALAPGSTLGHYTIQGSLGAGGMGVVYEAIDQKLHRTVAIKILPPGAIDEDTRLRFLREAQAASALNHPNIVTVYEVGREDGTDFIAMECISGQTMRHAIGKKGMPARTAVAHAIQIADALATAHEAGIVHRDLKPGNVMVTERGLVKLLDFGLAKLNRPAGDATAEMSLTLAGHAVGTVFYMSPEQAQGKNVDARSDIFSFGAVLYEMLTGARAFQGDSEIATLAAILEREPVPLAKIAPGVSPPLQRVISKCLVKKPRDRWQHMLDVKILLEDLLKDLDSPPAPPVRQKREARWLFPVLGVLAGAILTVAAFRFFRPDAVAAPEPVYRMLTATGGLNDYPVLSKDARLLAFSSDRGSGADNGDNLDIWLQQIGAREPIRLTRDPADETDPAFSPDGARIAFRSEKDGGGIYVVPSLGGEPMLLVQGGRNPRFSPDGRWIAYWTGRNENVSRGSSAVFIVESGGGQPRPIHPEMGTAFYPSWSPSGDRLIVRGWLGHESKETFDFWSLPIDGGEVKKSGGYPALRAQGLVPVRQLGWEGPLEWIGNRAIFAATLGDSTNLWEVDLSKEGAFLSPGRRITRGPGRQVSPAWAASAETERVVFTNQAVNYDVWSIPMDPAHGKPTGEMTRLTNSISTEWSPSISDDGRVLLYISAASGEWGLILRALDTGRTRTLIAGPTVLASARISGDGRRVAYVSGRYDLLTIPASGGAVEKLCDHCGTIRGISYDGNSILYEPVKDEDLLMFDVKLHKSIALALRAQAADLLSGARFSPDAKWVAFHSMEGAAQITRVWVAPVHRDHPAAQSEWIPVTEAGEFARDPCWSPNGSVLYFTSERDGFRCFWAQPLDQNTKKPAGAAFPLRHFHSARQSLRALGPEGYQIGLSAGAGRTVFSFPELTGNIWLQETPRGK